MQFSDLNISKPILNALEDAGFESPTPIQTETFSIIRSGNDMIGIAQTGTGKTLAYLIPILMKLHYAQGAYPRAVVIVPTRELVLQVCESAELLTEYMDIRCLGIYGGTNIRTQQDKVLEGIDLLVSTPGRFIDIYMNGILRTQLIKTVVIDEADRLMDLGFMPQLRNILDVLPEKHQTLLFSATFSETVTKIAENFMVTPQRVEVVRQSMTVDTVTQYRYDVPNILTKVNLLKCLLADKETYKKVMIFTETKKNADRIVDRLSSHWKDELSVIHSNKAQNTRINALNAFREGRARIMVASDVAARGIDIQDVSHVINFDIPSMAEEYVHRIGRTARAGKDGVAISFVTEKEIDAFNEIERLIQQQVEVCELPENLEISDVLLEEEKFQTSNINYQKGGRPQGGGAFHSKIAKNSKTRNYNTKAKKSLEAKRKKRK